VATKSPVGDTKRNTIYEGVILQLRRFITLWAALGLEMARRRGSATRLLHLFSLCCSAVHSGGCCTQPAVGVSEKKISRKKTGVAAAQQPIQN